MAIERADIIDYIKNLTVLELSELVKELEDVLGVSAAAPMAAAPAVVAEAEEAQTEFTLELIDYGDKKIQSIKAVRQVLGLGLKEAKDFVENLPRAVKEGVSKEEAEELKAKFEAAGASAVIK